jgi:hypothetical protein
MSFLPALLASQVPKATARAVAAPPVIDGRLNDPAWLEAPPVTGFIQRELHEGQPVTQRTEVRIITDGQALYVGAWLYDTDPAGIVAGAKVRDGDITKSDYFGILLDTYHDRQNGFVFTTTPAAIEYDAQVVNEGEGGGVQLPGQTSAMAGALGGFNLNWDGTWTVRRLVRRVPDSVHHFALWVGEGADVGAQSGAQHQEEQRRGVLVFRAAAVQPQQGLTCRHVAGDRGAVGTRADSDALRPHRRPPGRSAAG